MRLEIRTDQVEEVKNQVSTFISLALPEDQAALVEAWVSNFVVPNSFLNPEATGEARAVAREAVEPVYVTLEEDEIILREGEVNEGRNLVLHFLHLIGTDLQAQDPLVQNVQALRHDLIPGFPIKVDCVVDGCGRKLHTRYRSDQFRFGVGVGVDIVAHGINVIEDPPHAVYLLSGNARVSRIVDLLHGCFCSALFLLRRDLALISDPAWSPNVCRADVSDFKIDAAGEELKTQDEGQGYDKGNTEQEDTQRPPRGWSRLGAARIKSHVGDT
ncbi:hypothetical protein ES703_85226 [subsurface metagenome]